MSLPRPPKVYDEQDQLELRRMIENELAGLWPKGSDMDLGPTRIIGTSPDGTRWALTFNDDGVPTQEPL